MRNGDKTDVGFRSNFPKLSLGKVRLPSGSDKGDKVTVNAAKKARMGAPEDDASEAFHRRKIQKLEHEVLRFLHQGCCAD